MSTQRLTISEVAERHLERWLNQTMRGELPLDRLPAPVAAFYFAGWVERDRAAQAEAREAEHQLDLMALALLNPKDRAAEYQARLQRHFEAEADRFFAEPYIEGPAQRERKAA